MIIVHCFYPAVDAQPKLKFFTPTEVDGQLHLPYIANHIAGGYHVVVFKILDLKIYPDQIYPVD